MAQGYDMDEIQKEIRDLILHSKSKRTTIFEPCNINNLSEYLTYVQEVITLMFDLLSIFVYLRKFW